MSVGLHSSLVVVAFLTIALGFQVTVINASEFPGSALLTFDRERIYDNDTFTLRCSFPTHLALTSVTLESFKYTTNYGTLSCNLPSGSTTGTGVFTGRQFAGCPMYPGGSGHVSVTMQASRMLALNYSCTLKVNNGNAFFFLNSSVTTLELSVLPEPVALTPSHWTFNETDNLTIGCHSRFGIPPAQLNLTIFSQTKPPVSTSGRNVTYLSLPSHSKDWHNSSITCKVQNHPTSEKLFFNQVLLVNYIEKTDSPSIQCTLASNVTLDCSSYVISYPKPSYFWSVPRDSSVTALSRHVGSTFIARQETSGLFNCTATNNVTMKSVTVVFTLSSDWHCLPQLTFCERQKFACYGTPVVILVIIGAVIAGILRIWTKKKRDVTKASEQHDN